MALEKWCTNPGCTAPQREVGAVAGMSTSGRSQTHARDASHERLPRTRSLAGDGVARRSPESRMDTRRNTFKASQVFTWDSEPSDERPSEFASSAFMSAAPPRPASRQRKRPAVGLLVYVAATLCASSLLLLGLLGLLKS